MATILYGIPNCDQIKKARAWLDAHAVAYIFHDFKKSGIQPELVTGWLRDVGWEVLLNRKGTTWRALPDERKAAVADAHGATALMLEAPSSVKRPVLAAGGRIHVGFSEALYQDIFKNKL